MKDLHNLVELKIGTPCKSVMLTGDEDQSKYAIPHRHNYFEFVWCLDNSGSQVIDFQKYENRKGRIFALTPGQVHETAPDCGRTNMLIFSTDFVDKRYRKQALLDKFFSMQANRSPYIDTTDDAYPYLDAQFQLIHEETNREKPNWDLIESLTISFLFYVARYSKLDDVVRNQRDSRVSELLSLIEDNYKTQKRCDFYSNKLSLTNKRINELTRSAMGKTVTALVHERIILEANRDLIFTTKSVKNIALELGFSDPSYFGRFYANHTGYSPLSLRKATFN